MTGIVSLAQIIVNDLSSYGAEYSAVPELFLAELDSRRIIVVPVSVETRLISRTQIERVYKIEIGVVQKAKDSELDKIIDFVEQLATNLLKRKFGNTTCLSVLFDPLYSAEDMRERNQFTSVISLSLKEIC